MKGGQRDAGAEGIWKRRRRIRRSFAAKEIIHATSRVRIRTLCVRQSPDEKDESLLFFVCFFFQGDKGVRICRMFSRAGNQEW